MNRSIDADFNGVFQVENRYDFLNLNTCRFVWKRVQFPAVTESGEAKVLKQGEVKGPDVPAHGKGTLTIPFANDGADALQVTAVDKYGNELFTWSYPLPSRATKAPDGTAPAIQREADRLTVTAGGRVFTFSQKDGQLKGVSVNGKQIDLKDGPRFICAKRADRSMDQFYNHDDKDAEKKKTQYTEFEDLGKLVSLDAKEDGNRVVVTATYKLGCFDMAVWTIDSEGTALLDFYYNFSGVVDLMGVKFDYPEELVVSKRWVGDGPYRVWQNRLHGPQYGLWENDYNDPIPGESFDYPEFKGYFAHVDWMSLRTKQGTIHIQNETPDSYIGIYEPRDGRDHLLYTLPKTGISVMKVIPPVRNKVNTTDLIGPSSQAKWVDGTQNGRIVLRFE